MNIVFYINSSENEHVNKSISQIKESTGVFKENAPVETVDAIVSYDADLLLANYCYVPKFNRYYFVKLETMPGGRIHIIGSVDPLMSFREQILELEVILDSTEGVGKDLYLPHESWVRNCKDKTDIINFPNALLTNGEFILITAGGGVTI